jgi:hypothetical protein
LDASIGPVERRVCPMLDESIHLDPRSKRLTG